MRQIREIRTTLGLAVLGALAMHVPPAAANDPDVTARTISGIAEMLDLPIDQVDRKMPVRIEGVVTFRHDQPADDRIAMVIQDGRAAMWVIAPYGRFEAGDEGFSEFAQDVGPGSRVAVEGVTDLGGYSPRVLARAIRPLEREPLPAPLSAEESGIFHGGGSAVRMALEGIVQIVRSDKGVWTLTVDADGRRVGVRSARPPGSIGAEQLVDARVRLTGVAASTRNSRGQFLSPIVVINSFDDIERVEAPPTPAFESPFVPLADIGRFGSVSLDGHRFQTEGVVSRSQPTRYLFLQDGAIGLRIETGDKEIYAPGDRVRVAGFIDMGRQLRGVTGAITRRITTGEPPRPIAVSPDLITAARSPVRRDRQAGERIDYAGRLVVFRATIADSGPTRDGGVLRLASDDTILEAALPPEAFARVLHLAPGSEISITGIVQYDVARQHEEQVDGRLNPFEKFTLLVHSPDDVQLLRAAPWWTPMRLSAALVAVLTVLAAALAWAWALRRQVARQAAVVAKEMRARRESAVDFQATLRERTRLAANLHDTLLQTMAGIGFQLEACQMSARRSAGDAPPAESAEHLDVARRMVDHAVDDIRGSVWALRSTTVQGHSLTEVIDGLVARIGAGHRAHITARSAGEPFTLPNFVTGNLLLIVQEAIFNALRHGDPATIDVLVSFAGQAGMIDVVIRDDGRGFALGGQRGPEEGHFGLQGMRERTERLGGRLSIESTPGQGTTIRCGVRCREYDPDMEHDAIEPTADDTNRPVASV